MAFIRSPKAVMQGRTIMIEDPQVRAKIRLALRAVGFDATDWVRVVLYRKCFEFIRSLGPEKLDVLEISAGPQWKREFKFNSYRETHYPNFDICSQTLDEKFDLIIADQVFEHLLWPYRAGRNVYEMLKPCGYLLIAVPFLVRVHRVPTDCTRWTEEGLSYFLQECGFDKRLIHTDSWGNRACVRANFNSWKRFGWGRSLRNEPDFPVMIWAFAQKEPQKDTGQGGPVQA
jgi:SAM-dependent methyltransferase